MDTAPLTYLQPFLNRIWQVWSHCGLFLNCEEALLPFSVDRSLLEVLCCITLELKSASRADSMVNLLPAGSTGFSGHDVPYSPKTNVNTNQVHSLYSVNQHSHITVDEIGMHQP